MATKRRVTSLLCFAPGATLYNTMGEPACMRAEEDYKKATEAMRALL